MATGSDGLTEIGILFTEEGYDSLLDKVKSVTNASADLIQENQDLASAAGKVASAQTNLSNQIDRAILSYAASKSELLDYKAAQIGATGAMAEQLAMLREMETHARNQSEAFKARQQDAKDEKGLAADRIKDAQLAAEAEIKAGQQALAAAQKKSTEMMAMSDRVNKYLATKREEDLADEQARQNKYAKMGDGVEKFRLEQAARTSAIAQKAANDAVKISEKQAIEEITWAKKSVAQRIALLEQLKAYQANAAISPETTAAKFGAGAMKDLPNLAALQKEYATSLTTVSAGHKAASESGKTFSETLKEVNLNTSRARSEIIVLAHEALQGRFSRIPASMMVFAEYSNLSAVAMTAVGVSLLSAAAAGIAFAVFAIKGQLEFSKLNETLVTTGNYAGMTTSSFYKMADSMTAVHGRVGEAKDILMALAESGKFTRQQIDTIAPAILEMAHVGSKAAQEVIADFTKLADDPVKASQTLNEHYHYLTGSVYDQIVALEKQGDQLGAVNLAEQAYANASKDRMAQLVSNLGFVERAWNNVTAAISWAKAGVMSWGRAQTDAEQMVSLQKTKAALEATGGGGGFDWLGGPNLDGQGRSKKQALEDANLDIANLKRKMITDDLAASRQATTAQMQQDSINDSKRYAAEEDRNKTNAQIRDDRKAKLLDAASGRNLEGLRESGKFNLEELKAAGAREVLAAGATGEQILAADKRRYDAVVALAKSKGVELVLTEERTAKNLANIDAKKHDKIVHTPKVKEFSRVDNTKDTQDAERDYRIQTKLNEQTIRDNEKLFASNKKLADDSYAVAKNDADARSAIHIADIKVYTDYIDKIKALNDARVANERKAIEQETADAQERARRMLAAANAQQTNSPDGARRKQADIEKATDQLNEVIAVNEQRIKELTQSGVQNVLEAESRAFKDQTADINKEIVSIDKKIATKKTEYDSLGLTKQRQIELYALQQQQNALNIASKIASETAAKNSGDLSAAEVKMYDERIAKLQILYDKTQQLAKINEDLSARQKDWQAGAIEGMKNYSDSIDDVFTSTRKVTEKTFKAMEDALVKFATTGKLSVKDMVSSINSDLLRMMIQQQITKPISDAMNTGMSGGGGIISGLGGILNLFKGGGGGSGIPMGGSPDWMASAGSQLPIYDKGTDYVPRDGLAMIHQGEKITPASKNVTGAMNNGMTNHITFILSSPPDRRTQDQIAARVGSVMQTAMSRNM